MIATERLDLIALDEPMLEAFATGDREAAAALLGYEVPVWPEDTSTFARRLGQLRADPGLGRWLLRAIVDREQGAMVGQIGCHDRPGAAYLDEWAPGGVEFGYRVLPPFRRHGIATEALGGMLDWARREGVARFVLSISPTNDASNTIARHFGFTAVGIVEDPEDGPEAIWLLAPSAPSGLIDPSGLGGVVR